METAAQVLVAEKMRSFVLREGEEEGRPFRMYCSGVAAKVNGKLSNCLEDATAWKAEIGRDANGQPPDGLPWLCETPSTLVIGLATATGEFAFAATSTSSLLSLIIASIFLGSTRCIICLNLFTGRSNSGVAACSQLVMGSSNSSPVC